MSEIATSTKWNKDVFIALAAVAWADGTLDPDEADAIVRAAVDEYLDAKRLRCSPRTIELEEERLVLVMRHFGDVPLSAITAKAIADLPWVSRAVSISPWSSACTSGAAAPPRLRRSLQKANHSAMSASSKPSLPSSV